MINSIQGYGDVLAFIGSIIGSIIVGVTTWLIIRHDTRQYRDDKFDNTFFNLLNIFKEERNKDIKNFLEQFLQEIGELKYQIEQKTYDEKINAYIKNKKIVSPDVIDKIYKNVVEINNNYGNEVGNIFADLIPIIPLKNVVSKLKKSPTYLDFKEFYDLVERKIDRNLMTQLDKIFEDINIEKEKIKSEKIDFLEHEKNIKDEINIIGDKFHPDLGTYFRSFYIVIDSIIDNKSLDLDRKRKYLRIIRSVLSSSELLSIFYNAFYYEKGKRVAELLSPESDFYFFAKKEDLEDIKKDYDSNSMSPDSELTYFKYNSLFFENLDLSKLIKNKKYGKTSKKKGVFDSTSNVVLLVLLFFFILECLINIYDNSIIMSTIISVVGLVFLKLPKEYAKFFNYNLDDKWEKCLNAFSIIITLGVLSSNTVHIISKKIYNIDVREGFNIKNPFSYWLQIPLIGYDMLALFGIIVISALMLFLMRKKD